MYKIKQAVYYRYTGDITILRSIVTQQKMTNLVKLNWLILPEILFTEIMLMVGLQSIDSLHKCRQVCRTWNENILRLIWKNLHKKKLIKLRIKEDWRYISKFKPTNVNFQEWCCISKLEDTFRQIPSSKEVSHAKWLEKKGLLPSKVVKKLQVFVGTLFKCHSTDERVITYAACLAHQGLLELEFPRLKLKNVDLSLIPVEQLNSLVSCVRGIGIKNVRGCDLSNIFKGLQRSSKIDSLDISQQSLGREETQVLVHAMESRVEIVTLGDEGEVKLDIMALTKYSGQGKCRMIMCNEGFLTSHREELETWAKSHDWDWAIFEPLVIFTRLFSFTQL